MQKSTKLKTEKYQRKINQTKSWSLEKRIKLLARDQSEREETRPTAGVNEGTSERS